ncbi:MAG: hypothetical protein IT165_27755 [Bryobacterales bacterium]|nr:hypothetical protein [Bryobacterales bacterium]
MRRRFTNFRGVPVLLVGLATCVAVHAQPVREMHVQLAAGFNTVEGRVITAGDTLVFMDDAQPQSSFYATRGQIDQISAGSGDNVVVQFKQPVRDRTGERMRVEFKVPPEDRDVLKSWFSRGASSTAASSGAAAQSEELTYHAQRNKRIGNDEGRLVVKSDRLAFVANNPSASREWLFTDIRSFKQKGPYRLEIQPFSGEKYNLKLLGGGGMSREDYKRVADSIARARAAKP